jgi:hypothetical protein
MAAAATATPSKYYDSELPEAYSMRPYELADNQPTPELDASPVERPPEELDSIPFGEMPESNN